MVNNYYGGIYSSDIGDIGIMTHKDKLIYVELFKNNMNTFHKYDTYSNLCEDNVSKKAANYIMQYLLGINTICDIALAPNGSNFQKSVWRTLLQIPCGETRSYKDIAIMLKNPNAMRAVGSACAKNPILFFIPCHRVVCSGGKIGGYRAGLDTKQYLLSLEKDSIKNSLY